MKNSMPASVRMTFNKYKVVFHPAAQKDLDHLQDKLRLRVMIILRSLGENPRPLGCKKLIGTINIYRIRVGDYRILYRVLDNERIIKVSRIAHRSQAYQ